MITKNSLTKSNFTFQLRMSNTFNIFLNNFPFNRHFSATARYLGPGEDKGKGKATKEDMAKWAKEEATKDKENREKDQEEKEMEKAIQESKWSEKLNTNEEAGPSNTDKRSTQADTSNNPVVTSDGESYNSDSSIDTEYQYVNGVEDQTAYYLDIRKNYENKNPDDPSFATEMEVYIKAQEKELKSVEDKLNDFGLSEAERRWQEGRLSVIVKELDDTKQTKETMEAMLREDQARIARLNDDEGLGKTPSPNPSSQMDVDSEDNNSSDTDNPDDSGPSASPSNPGPSIGPGDSSSNEPGPTGEEGSNGSYKVIIPSFALNFVAEIFEQITNLFFF
jgi:hypothetical protein